jgi:hypothetical protein
MVVSGVSLFINLFKACLSSATCVLVGWGSQNGEQSKCSLCSHRDYVGGGSAKALVRVSSVREQHSVWSTEQEEAHRDLMFCVRILNANLKTFGQSLVTPL